MGLDINHSVNLGLYCGQDIHHNSSHSIIREQTLVQEISNPFYWASVYCGNNPHCGCLDTVPSSPRAMEPDHTRKPLKSRNSTRPGLLGSMFRPLYPRTLLS